MKPTPQTKIKPKSKDEDLAKRVMEWYNSYDTCPPWSSVLGFIVRENKKVRESTEERVRGEILKRDFFIAEISANFDGSTKVFDIVVKEPPPLESSYITVGKYGGLRISGAVKVFKSNEIQSLKKPL